MKDFPSSSISIEELNLQNDEAGRLLDIIEGLNGDCSGEEKVYMVNFLPDATSKVVGEDPDKVIEDNSYAEKNILLVYWPPLTSDPVPKTIAIAGAYEDESTRLYYFLVPPAVVADSLLIALCVVGEAFANGSFDFGSH